LKVDKQSDTTYYDALFALGWIRMLVERENTQKIKNLNVDIRSFVTNKAYITLRNFLLNNYFENYVLSFGSEGLNHLENDDPNKIINKVYKFIKK
jgi:hypothetical protein